MGKEMIDSESKSQQGHVYGHYKNWQDNLKLIWGTQRTKKNQGSLRRGKLEYTLTCEKSRLVFKLQ